MRERETETERHTERDRDREKDPERLRKRERQRERERQTERDRQTRETDTLHFCIRGTPLQDPRRVLTSIFHSYQINILTQTDLSSELSTYVLGCEIMTHVCSTRTRERGILRRERVTLKRPFCRFRCIPLPTGNRRKKPACMISKNIN